MDERQSVGTFFFIRIVNSAAYFAGAQMICWMPSGGTYAFPGFPIPAQGAGCAARRNLQKLAEIV